MTQLEYNTSLFSCQWHNWTIAAFLLCYEYTPLLILLCCVEFVKLKKKELSHILETHRTIHSLVAAKLILAKLKQIQNHTSGQCSYQLSSLIQMQETSD